MIFLKLKLFTRPRFKMTPARIKKQKGMAILEAIPIIWVMFVLMGATLGSWGLVHTATLNSIAARNFVFFYFNNRSDLSYMRDFHGTYDDVPLGPEIKTHYFGKLGKRFSYIRDERVRGKAVATPTGRHVDFRKINSNDPYPDRTDFLENEEHSRIFEISGPKIPLNKKTKRKVGPAWLMVGYGICLNARCEPE